MGDTPRGKSITIEFDCQFQIELERSDFSSVMKAFLMLLPRLMEDFFQKVLTGFGEYEMSKPQKSFVCKKCGNDKEFRWKTRHGKETGILTWFRWIKIKQLQVQCKACGHKQNISRHLLGMKEKQRIPDETVRKLGLAGALSSYRVSEKMGKMFGWAVDKMTIWKSVQKIGKALDFALDPQEKPHGEADGTGIGIVGASKRGKELKVLIQYKHSGGVRVAGIDIGDYHGTWKNLFKNSIDVIKGFKQPFLLMTDGDTSILDGLKSTVKVLVQRCLWHIPHQAKYALWKDKVKHKGPEWLNIISELIEICVIRSLVDCPDTIKAMIRSKNRRLRKIIKYCEEKNFKHTVSYLENARNDMFTALENRLNGKTTSRVERVFKNTNMRTDVGTWSKEGVLNVLKVRLAYYYNGFDA